MKRNRVTKERVPKKLNFEGYLLIYLPDHSRSDRQGYVFEHIVIAEKKYNREITVKEAVHHIDRNKSNNDPENLIIVSHAEHRTLHASEKIGKKYRKRFISVTIGKGENYNFECVEKEKLPRGYYYLRTTKNKRKTEK